MRAANNNSNKQFSLGNTFYPVRALGDVQIIGVALNMLPMTGVHAVLYVTTAMNCNFVRRMFSEPRI